MLGNIFKTWGNLSAQELVHRHWIMLCRSGCSGRGVRPGHRGLGLDRALRAYFATQQEGCIRMDDTAVAHA